MRDQFDSWNHSAAATKTSLPATIVTPHRFPDKWIVKGLNGWNHSVAFTLGNFPEPSRSPNSTKTSPWRTAPHAMKTCCFHKSTSPSWASRNPASECHGNVGHDKKN
ncbi:MAG: hypothetical protein R2856_37665 [Caldilineaceae bacterium]